VFGTRTFTDGEIGRMARKIDASAAVHGLPCGVIVFPHASDNTAVPKPGEAQP
jgi:hypothetical protein